MPLERSWPPPAFSWGLKSDKQLALFFCISLLVTAPLGPPQSPGRRGSLKVLFCRLQGACNAIFLCFD